MKKIFNNISGKSGLFKDYKSAMYLVCFFKA